MHAAIVELDALADAVGTAAEDHDLAPLAHGDLVGAVVGGVVIGRVLDAADGHRVPGLDHAQTRAALANIHLGDTQQFSEIPVGKPVFFGLHQELVGQLLALVLEDFLFQGDQLGHLPDEPVLDAGLVVERLDRGTLAQGLVHDELSLARRVHQQAHELLQ